MDLNPELYCDPRTFRFVPGFTCCTPEPPEVLKPVFTLHRRFKPPQILDWTDPRESKKIGYGKVIILVHGWSETLETSVWIMHAAKAFVSRGFPTIVVDWREGNKYYFQTCANVRTIGAVIGYSILAWKVRLSLKEIVVIHVFRFHPGHFWLAIVLVLKLSVKRESLQKSLED